MLLYVSGSDKICAKQGVSHAIEQRTTLRKKDAQANSA
jgi:hypothetical protein